MPDVNDTGNLPGDGRSATGSYARLRQTILTSQVMLYAYAAVLVILALGVVALVVAIGVMSFQHPEKAQPFWQLIGGFVVGLIIDLRGAAGTAKALMRKPDERI